MSRRVFFSGDISRFASTRRVVDLRLARRERPHDDHARQVLLHPAERCRELAVILEAAVDALAEEPHRERHQRQQDQAEVQREPRADPRA